MKERSIFLDGELIPTEEPMLDGLSPWVLSGRGVFETMRSYGGKIFLVDEHLKRFFEGLKILKIQVPHLAAEIKRYLYLSLKTNKLKNARLRLTVWQGKVGIRLSIIVWPYKPEKKEKYRQGFKAIISHLRQDRAAQKPAIKSIDYLLFLQAYRIAKVKGKDEALLLNNRGYLVEGSRSNIFFVKDNVLFTPSLASGCLDGITRQTVLRIAKNLKFKCQEALVQPQELFKADEAFLTNSLMELMPLTYVQNKKIGWGTIGPVTAKLLREYRKQVRKAVR